MEVLAAERITRELQHDLHHIMLGRKEIDNNHSSVVACSPSLVSSFAPSPPRVYSSSDVIATCSQVSRDRECVPRNRAFGYR
jgi:hypothetical protein